MARATGDARSRAPITKPDLKRLARIAREEREDFFSRHAEWALLYARRVLCSALCGEAALHYLNGTSGVRGFQVWSFYAEHPDAPFPHRFVSRRDFGTPKFGREPGAASYVGRRVEVNGRSIRWEQDDDPVTVLQRYLHRGATPAARELRRRAVILIEPAPYLAYVAWPALLRPVA